MSSAPTPNLLRTAEAAARLGVTVRTLQRWAVVMPEVRAAQFRRGWWRVSALDQIGAAK